MKRKWMSILLTLFLLLGTGSAVAGTGTGTAISGTISESGVTVQVENLNKAAKLMVAQYRSGQLVDVVTENISCDGSYAIDAQKLVKGDEYKLFLVDKNSSAPLCKSVLPVQTADLHITESKTISGGTYRQVIIDESVGNGDVSLENVTIYGDLIVQGGGSNTIRMNGCAVHGKVNIDKTPGAGKEPPRLHLTDTSIPVVEATQPAIIEAGDSKSSVGELKASNDVTIQGDKTTVETVTVPDNTTPTVTVADGAKIETVAVSPDATANVNVELGASVVAVEAKGETTISAEGTVNSVTANANVTVSSGEVDRVEVPSSASSAVSITVSESATVNDVTVNTTNSVSINAKGENSVGSLSTDKSESEVETLKVTVVGNGNKGQQPSSHNWPLTWEYIDANSHQRVCTGHPNHPHTQIDVHTWDDGKVTVQPSCTASGEKTYTCTSCNGTKTVSIPPVSHTVEAIPGKQPNCTETGLTVGNRCSVCGTILLPQEAIPTNGVHSYTDGNDFDCNDCGKFRTVIYDNIFVRTFTRIGTDGNQLVITNGEPVLDCISFAPADCENDLHDGWSYGGWHVGIEDKNGSYTPHGIYTEMTEELKALLLDAVKNGSKIFLDITVGAEGMGKNGFDLTFDISSGNLEYSLSTPENPEDLYRLEFICLDRCERYSTGVSKYNKVAYSDIIWAHEIKESGYYNAVEIRKLSDNGKKGELIACWKLDDTFCVERNSGEITDPVTVSIGEDDYVTSLGYIHYVISGLSGNCTYQMHEEDTTGTYGSYGDFTLDDDGKLHFYVSTDYTITHTTLYGTSVSMQNGAFFLEITKPLTLTLPAYDGGEDDDGETDADWTALLEEAEQLGLLKYLDKYTLTTDGQITRLQAAMLVAALDGLVIPDSYNWDFDDGADLTSQQKAVIMALCNAGLMAGRGDGNFNPHLKMTNTEVITLLDSALGRPVVPVTKPNDIPTGFWGYWSYTMMDNLGIIDCSNINTNHNAIASDVLQWFINAKNWRAENPVNPSYNASGIHFGTVNGSPNAVCWTHADIPNGMDTNYIEYQLVMSSADGDQYYWIPYDFASFAPLYELDAGFYDTFAVYTMFAGRLCGVTRATDLSLTINESKADASALSVSFAPNADNAALYDVTVSGLAPNQSYELFIGENPGSFESGLSIETDANGSCTKALSVEASKTLHSGGYYIIRTSEMTVSEKKASVSYVNYCDWTPFRGSGSFAVTNIRFEDQFIKWDQPTAVTNDMDVHYALHLYGASGNANCGTGDLFVANYAFAPRLYERLEITTYVNGIEMATAETNISLTIEESSSAATPSVTFTEIMGGMNDDELVGYKVSLTGLAPNTSHIVHLVNSPNKWNWNTGDFREVVSDANGNASTEHFGPDVLELYKNGYLFVFEQTANNVILKNVATTSAAPIISGMRCTPASNTSWFENHNNMLELHWSYDLPAGSFERLAVYLSADDGVNWVYADDADLGDSHWCVNHIRPSLDLAGTTWNKVKVAAVKADGSEVSWFERSADLRFVKGGVSAASATFTPTGNSGMYRVNVSGLANSSTYSVIVSPDEGCMEYDRMFAVDNTSVDMHCCYAAIGSYMLREFTVSNVTADTALITYYDSAWEKCLANPVTYPAGNIRLEGSFVKWDAPADSDSLNGKIRYEVTLSTDGGSSWTRPLTTSQPSMFVLHQNAGVYDAVRIYTKVNEEIVGAVVDDTIRLTINNTRSTPAEVYFAPGSNGSYDALIAGLAPHTEIDISFAENPTLNGEWFSLGGYSGNNGMHSLNISSSHMDVQDVMNNGYFYLIEFNCENENSKTLTINITERGGWIKAQKHVTSSLPNETEVKNIRLDGTNLCWDVPLNSYCDRFEVSISGDNGENWNHLGRTDSDHMPLPLINEGSYNKVKIITLDQNNNELATVVVDLAFRINHISTADPLPSGATFVPTPGGYIATVSGLIPNALCAIHVRDREAGEGTAAYAVADELGNAALILDAGNAASIVENGEYRLLQLSDTTSDTFTVTIQIDWTKCFDTADDDTAPTFIDGYPMFRAGSSDAEIGLKLNCANVRYYCVITEVGNLPTTLKDGTFIDADNWILLPETGEFFDGEKFGNVSAPSSSDIMNPPYSGSKYITRRGDYTGSTISINIDSELEPGKQYIAYFVLQGSTSNSVSDVFAFRFETEQPSRPILTLSSLQIPSVLVESGCDTDVRYMLLANGRMDAILTQPMANIWNRDAAHAYGLSDTQISEYQAMTTLEAMAATFYMDSMACGSVFDLFATESAQWELSCWFETGGGTTAIAKMGTLSLTADSLTAEINCLDDMMQGQQYWFLVMGKSPLGSSYAFSAVGDLCIPQTNQPMVVALNTAVKTHVPNDDNEAYNTAYSGTVTLVFDSSLYLKQGSTYLQVVDKPIDAALDETRYISSAALLTSNQVVVDPQISANNESNPSCTTLVLDFTDMRVGNTITFNPNLSNSLGITGSEPLTLSLRLVANYLDVIIPEFLITSPGWDPTSA